MPAVTVFYPDGSYSVTPPGPEDEVPLINEIESIKAVLAGTQGVWYQTSNGTPFVYYQFYDQHSTSTPQQTVDDMNARLAQDIGFLNGIYAAQGREPYGTVHLRGLGGDYDAKAAAEEAARVAAARAAAEQTVGLFEKESFMTPQRRRLLGIADGGGGAFTTNSVPDLQEAPPPPAPKPLPVYPPPAPKPVLVPVKTTAAPGATAPWYKSPIVWAAGALVAVGIGVMAFDGDS